MSTPGSSDPDIKPSPILKPPGKSSLPDQAVNRNIRPLVLLAGMVALLIITGAVLFILPGILDNSAVQPAKPIETNSPGEVVDKKTEPSDKEHQQHLDEERDAATGKLENLLALKVQAESENIDIWAKEAYPDILSLEKRGDQLFTKQDYVQAGSYYEEALSGLSTLLASKSRRFNDYLENGYQFLSEEKSIEAQKSFSMALAINPDSQDARTGALKAENLDAVLALYQKARAHQQAGELAASRAALDELLQLDSSYVPAIALFAEVQGHLEKQQFEQLMSSIYTHLDNGDLKKARNSLVNLKKTKERHPEVILAEQVLIEKEESARINELRRRAETFSSEEQWKKAMEIYQQILTLSPNVLFAVNGQDQANKRWELDSALQNHLSQAHRLQDEKQLQAAKSLLTYARQFSPAGERLSRQISELANLVTHASTTVSVVIQSDNLTDILMYHVGKLGSFETKQIILKPGRYTIVGSRTGYRDIRKIIEVDPGKEKNEFFVACRDPI